jgi:two-component system OmpR family response regulator
MTRIIVVDDDAEIRQLVARYLEEHGLEVTAVDGGVALQRALCSTGADLVVLDVMLPDKDGLAICRDLRADGQHVPVILLTALAEESDRVLGLEIGADDYLIKPFSPRELLARIRAVLRRAPHQLAVHRDGGVRQYRFGGWTLEPGRRTLLDASGVLVSLTGGEYDLLVALARNPGRVLGRDQLLELTRGRAAQAFDRSVDVQMSRLRRKLGDPDLIKTVRGGGYLLSAEVAVDDE